MEETQETDIMKDRQQVIMRTSLIGIAANLALAAFKAGVGILTHSIAVVLDAVNNMSDALSSVITILGTKYAAKAPDKKHPLGHGRAEYLTAMLIAVLILYAGITSLVESVKKILQPEVPEYTTVSLLIVAAAVAVKILLGRYVKKTGESVNSDSLIASGEDAILDSVISASTLAAALLYIWFGLRLEAWLAAVISIVIIRSGIEMLRETLSRILGERVDADIACGIRRTIASFDEVKGVYDLLLHSYGPDTLVGSVHIEVPDTMTAGEIDALTRRIQSKVIAEHKIVLTTIGVYALNTGDDEAAAMRSEITGLVMSRKEVLQMHGFYLDPETKHVSFDVILDFAAPDRTQVYHEICEEMKEKYPNYTFRITLDVDVADLEE